MVAERPLLKLRQESVDGSLLILWEKILVAAVICESRNVLVASTIFSSLATVKSISQVLPANVR